MKSTEDFIAIVDSLLKQPTDMWEKVEVGNWVKIDRKWLHVIRIKKDFGICRFYTDNTEGYGIINPLQITDFSLG